ncbi:CCA tRNA nucleotidyltransferase [Aneurinibacillus thermoaerophilus]|uniref:CCA tRNA nucleotidyltransferase n=2 Tax=Aneurinibacillus thermoaerophilus TaxID=143495 RepID=A0A1G8BV11_ANETH|nr:CCA tRNA nucleotidyltransferase [Aneurinibacillus thermoaerophilus]MED0760383.1 CCA tRNA nucleotidyltransferase [Aneurinibacillus thermoaerophilus]QYY43886.1 CCA tRNA nucleotidyltransferase [Aneurinibacillus thermoaerophilus]SDH36540.1 tRNA nucleotidyltransferase (CCA-adding enzyme) [Aneurinibacillus thermoaerophilus]
MKTDVIEAGKQVLKKLEEAGYSAYFVGGYVRDTLLGRPVHDLDIATSARPEEVMVLFSRTVPTGLQHGTVTVLEGGVPLEVTTFRTESGYKDHRRPDEVRFVATIEEDLARRDFTVNAMALDLRGRVVDPFGGQKDLQNRIIRAVGAPQERFAEDALRMLRCIRFASQLGFAIDRTTYEAVRELVEDIRYVAVERINAEWNKALASRYPDRAVMDVLETGLARVMPGLNVLLSGKQEWSETERERLREVNGLAARWSYLFLVCGREADVESVLRALRSEKKLIKSCRQMIDLVEMLRLPEAEERSERWLLEYGWDALSNAASLYEIIYQAAGVTARLARTYDAMQVKTLQELAVSGAELQQVLGRKGGPWIRAMLLRLSLDVNKGEVPNERHALLLQARKVIDEYT